MEDKMPETLLSPSTILLYGRVLEDLTFKFKDPNSQAPNVPVAPPQRRGSNRFLQDQLEVSKDLEPDSPHYPRLARIYGYSYEGHYYDLPKPAIFLVHGSGDDPEEPRPATDPRVDRAPADADRTGVAYTGRSFSDDMRVWPYDKSDFTVRLDVESGTLEDVLLEAGGRADSRGPTLSGSRLHLRGGMGGHGSGQD
jgi:hypothetical protein